MTTKYAVCIERSPTGFSAYLPDLPGCVAAGGTLEETEALIRDCITTHIEGMREDGDPIPEPTMFVEMVEVVVSSAA